jgi:hypothetical protein
VVLQVAGDDHGVGLLLAERRERLRMVKRRVEVRGDQNALVRELAVFRGRRRRGGLADVAAELLEGVVVGLG